MSSAFGAISTTDQVLEGVNLSGKRVQVTGVGSLRGRCRGRRRALL
jgi:hypothetical protein